jgi:hypothetical protein
MTVDALFALLVPIFIGLSLTIFLIPGEWRENLLIRLCFAPALGVGISSCLTYLAMQMLLPIWGLVLVELAVLAACVGLNLWSGKIRLSNKFSSWRDGLFLHKTIPGNGFMSGLGWFLTVIFAAVILAETAAFVSHTMRNPHGTFDAYAIWNQRARMLFFTEAGSGTAFSALINWKFHADYPMLLPLSVLRLWRIIGSETLRVPMLLALLFTFSAPMILFAAVGYRKSRVTAAFAGILLLGTPWLFQTGTALTADLPLAVFIVSAGICFYRYGVTYQGGWLVLSGLFSGLAAWTKNEGLLFLGVIILMVSALALFHQRRNLRTTLGSFALGCSLPLTAVIYFKLFMAPPGDLLAGRTAAQILSLLVQPERYQLILATFVDQLLHFGGWNISLLGLLVIWLLVSWTRPAGDEGLTWVFTALLPLLMLMGYFMIYVITPHPLAWHLKYSVDRLFFQIYPLMLLVVFLRVQTMEHMLDSLQSKTGAKVQ